MGPQDDKVRTRLRPFSSMGERFSNREGKESSLTLCVSTKHFLSIELKGKFHPKVVFQLFSLATQTRMGGLLQHSPEQPKQMGTFLR